MSVDVMDENHGVSLSSLQNYDNFFLFQIFCLKNVSICCLPGVGILLSSFIWLMIYQPNDLLDYLNCQCVDCYKNYSF